MRKDALTATGRSVIVVAIVFITTSCGTLEPLDYEKVERSATYVGKDQVAEIVAEALSREDVISSLGEPAVKNDETRGFGFERCLDSESVEILWTPIPLMVNGKVKDCQFIAVWFNESGHAVRAASYVKNFEIDPHWKESAGELKAPTPENELNQLLKRACEKGLWYLGNNPACVKGKFTSQPQT